MLKENKFLSPNFAYICEQVVSFSEQVQRIISLMKIESEYNDCKNYFKNTSVRDRVVRMIVGWCLSLSDKNGK